MRDAKQVLVPLAQGERHLAHFAQHGIDVECRDAALVQNHASIDDDGFDACAGFGEDQPAVATPDETDEPANRRADYVLKVEPPSAGAWSKL